MKGELPRCHSSSPFLTQWRNLDKHIMDLSLVSQAKEIDLKDKAEAIQMTFYGQKSNNYNQAAYVQKSLGHLTYPSRR
ncbi:hypothetical protein CEXT_809321 [Caerostris extrusa]|uniref:Uncharacterized protein n=1 Tax=Caerostris extrusa TaxID=172846 RepID=A0AAV4YCH1_CAEEX|nr:hypothetical protein CEXT_809321 [Caerostris extrusa]